MTTSPSTNSSCKLRLLGWMERAKRILDVLAALATIIAILFAVIQYYKIEADGRVTETLTYVARFNSDPVSGSFKQIYEAWATLRTPMPSDPLEAERQFVEEHDLNWSTVQVGDFFDQLYICIERDLCDEDLAITMLGRDVVTTYSLTGRYLAASAWPTGCGLRALWGVAKPRLDYSQLSSAKRREQSAPRPVLPANACPLV